MAVSSRGFVEEARTVVMGCVACGLVRRPIQVQYKLVRQGGQIVSWFSKTKDCKFRTACQPPEVGVGVGVCDRLPWSWDSDSELDGPIFTPRTEVCHNTYMDVSSEEPLVRPNTGRDMIARTQVSGTCNAESRHVRSTVHESNVLSVAT